MNKSNILFVFFKIEKVNHSPGLPRNSSNHLAKPKSSPSLSSSINHQSIKDQRSNKITNKSTEKYIFFLIFYL